MHHQTTLRVRQLVYEAFREMGVGDPIEPHESMLIQGGYFCGRRFICGDFQAVWFFEDNQVKVYSADGGVWKVFDLVASDVMVQSRVA